MAVPAMRRIPAFTLCLLLPAVARCAPLVASAQAATPTIPKLEGRVNDYAHVLSPQQKAQLESFLKGVEDRTSNQIVILTVPSLEGDTIEDYAVRVFKAWKLGQKGRDNDVLVVAAINDRKMRIEVGYGLEGALTDAVSSQIIRNEMTPRFRASDYGGGLLAGVTAIDKATRGEYKAAPRKPQSRIDPGIIIFWMIVLFVILISHLRFRRYRNHWIGPYWISTSGSSSSGGMFSGEFSGGGGGFSGGGGGSGGGGASGGW